MNKKLLGILVLVLVLTFSTTAFASLTFTTDAITGTSASAIDLGVGNTLSIQTIGNGAINLGSGLLTSTGGATFSGIVQGLNIFDDIATTNIALNSTALNRTTTGLGNIALGANSLIANTNGNVNTALGGATLAFNTSGNYNTAVGNSSLWKNTIGIGNTAIGRTSLASSTTANNNTGLGYSAGYKSGATPATANAVITGSNLTFVGYQAGLGSTTQRTNSTALGNEAYVDADNTVVLGDENVVDVFAGSAKQASVTAGQFKLSALNTAPTTASDACTAGEIRIATGFIYVCVATNSWQRSTMAAW